MTDPLLIGTSDAMNAAKCSFCHNST